MCKKFDDIDFQFFHKWCQPTYFLTFKPLFEVWLLFQVPHPITWQKYLSFSNAEFNSASIDTKFVKVGQTELYKVWRFLFPMWRFSANLIKFTFSVFTDPSGRVGKFSPVPYDGEKLGGTFKKKIKSIPLQELWQERKEKKRYFIIYID